MSEELLENSEQNSSSDENQEEVRSDTDQKKSNDKKFDIWKEYKKLKKENKILKMTDDDEEEEEQEQPSQDVKSNDDVRLEIFLLKNKEAVEYEEEIKSTLAEFPNMSYDKAFAFSKANYTKSETKKDFSTTSATPKKELKDYSKEEILAMKDKKKLLEWSRANWDLG